MWYDRVAAKARTVQTLSPTAYSGVGYQNPDYQDPVPYGEYLATSNDFCSAANVRAKQLAKLPILEVAPNGEESDEGDLVGLLEAPNPEWTKNRLLKTLELSLCTWGEHYWLLERGATGLGRVREIWPVRSGLIRPVPHPTDYTSGYLFYPPGGGRPEPLRREEVVWFRYPNPNDDYAPLAPLAAARLAADTASAMMKSNRNLFDQGMLGGGFIFPPDELQQFSVDQAVDLEREIDKRFRGVGKAHRWAVMLRHFKTTPMNVTPRDAQFVEGMNLSFRQVCRALGVPPPLVGDAEFATLANLRTYERQLWEHTMEDEADFVAAEVTRQIGRAFDREMKFDLSAVVSLQEDETEKWTREKDQIDRGVIVINEWREDNGMDRVPWGDVWWAPATLVPAESETLPATEGYTAADWNRLAVRGRAFERQEDQFGTDLRGYFSRQRDDVVRRLRESASPDEPFDLEAWGKRAEEVALPRILGAMESAFDQAAAEIRSTRGKSELRRKATLQAGTLAGEMNTTTFKELRLAMRQVLDAGGSTEDLIVAVDKVMDHARKTRARLIAISETTGAVTDGQLEAWSIEGLEVRKRWVTANDERVRDTHHALHGATVGLAEVFYVGACVGIGPGRTGCAGEDINCRCVLAPVLAEPRGVWNNQDLAVILRGMNEALT